jgi:ADP-ribose pyrophosphatase YjhB (NUDIX family)
VSDSRPRDLPAGGGALTRLHLFAGNLAILGVSLLRPRLTLGVRLAAFDAEGRVFLVRHSYLPGWHLPGGGIDRGETARAAARREAAEEGGIECLAEPAFFHLYHHATTGRHDHVALFTVQDARQRAGWSPGGAEILEAGFFAVESLPETATPATRTRLAELRGEAPPSDHW